MDAGASLTSVDENEHSILRLACDLVKVYAVASLLQTIPNEIIHKEDSGFTCKAYTRLRASPSCLAFNGLVVTEEQRKDFYKIFEMLCECDIIERRLNKLFEDEDLELK